jgi:hypothetical protein
MSKSKKVKKTTTKNTMKKRPTEKELWTPAMMLFANMLAHIYEPSVNEGRNVPDYTFDEIYEIWSNCWIANKKPFAEFAKLYFDYKDGKVNKQNVNYYLAPMK